ncbi:MAG: hypothetical protein AB7L92_06105, partial [Alphaproteobacteria bacterium]
IYGSQEFPESWGFRISEYQEFIVIPILMPATQGQSTAIIPDRKIAAPIFHDYFVRLNTALLKPLRHILR